MDKRVFGLGCQTPIGICPGYHETERPGVTTLTEAQCPPMAVLARQRRYLVTCALWAGPAATGSLFRYR